MTLLPHTLCTHRKFAERDQTCYDPRHYHHHPLAIVRACECADMLSKCSRRLQGQVVTLEKYRSVVAPEAQSFGSDVELETSALPRSRKFRHKTTEPFGLPGLKLAKTLAATRPADLEGRKPHAFQKPPSKRDVPRFDRLADNSSHENRGVARLRGARTAPLFRPFRHSRVNFPVLPDEWLGSDASACDSKNH
jgi:hypothetical protein